MIKKLDWDSNFFGFNIAHLELDDAISTLSLSSINDFIKSNEIKCIQTCCDISDVKKINFLEENGFNFVDLKITFILDINTIALPENEIEFSIANVDDVPALKNIAISIAPYSRYYNKRFDKKKVELLYEIWLEKSVHGKFDDVCLKTMKDDIPVGFATIKFFSNNARIGLVGVDKAYRNKGIGKKLLASVFSFLQTRNVEKLEVVTQGKNIQAQNFYICNGFKIKSVESWYYKWIG